MNVESMNLVVWGTSSVVRTVTEDTAIVVGGIGITTATAITTGTVNAIMATTATVAATLAAGMPPHDATRPA